MLADLAIAALGVVIAFVVAVLALRLLFPLPTWTPPQPHAQRTSPSKRRKAIDFAVSGIYILDDGLDAFAARFALLQQAERNIDLQYYMWHGDMTGMLLLHEVVKAADRGAKVRLLIDDNTTAGDDGWMAAAAQHRNIEVRLFNPFMLRRWRGPNYIFDFRRVNRRMHNKSFTVDGRTTIVGGRNLGDEYFSAHADMHFADMDVLAEGPVVSEILNSFEAYWASPSSYPAEHILPPVEPDALDGLRRRFATLLASAETETYLGLVSRRQVLRDITERHLGLEQVPVKLAVDDPAKGEGDIPRRLLLLDSFEKNLGQIETSLDVATAYFVPGRFGSTFLTGAADAGKRVRVLTNSLASNDVVPVHAGYARYRKRLLRRGVQLYELRGSRPEASQVKGKRRRLPRFGASSSSLHAKVFVLDQTRVFIGSFNLDPRSIYLNCEMGLLIDSPKLGARITRQMNGLIEARSYHPFIETANRLSWRDNEGKVYRMEPESTARQRVFAWVISWLPVEWLL